MSDRAKAMFIDPPNLLKDRAIPLDSGSLDFSATQKAVEKLGQEFLQRLPEEFIRIDQAAKDLKASPHNPACRTALFGLVHDLKGIAGTFDFMLLTVIGNDLCRFIEHAKDIEHQHIKVVEYHIAAMKKVVKYNMIGNDHKGGRQLIDALHRLTQKALVEKHSEVQSGG